MGETFCMKILYEIFSKSGAALDDPTQDALSNHSPLMSCSTSDDSMP